MNVHVSERERARDSNDVQHTAAFTLSSLILGVEGVCVCVCVCVCVHPILPYPGEEAD